MISQALVFVPIALAAQRMSEPTIFPEAQLLTRLREGGDVSPSPTACYAARHGTEQENDQVRNLRTRRDLGSRRGRL
jgi:hypothetical protein